MHKTSRSKSNMNDLIDISFDFRTDTPVGKDPDTYSPTLRRYHKALWSKPLPSGKLFDLDDSYKSKYLLHQSELGKFVLTSDSCIPTFTRWKRMEHIVGQFTEKENDAFRAIGYTIGGMMVWPGVAKPGVRTINVERGFNSMIADRLDLTMECIRRYYLGVDSPMTAVLTANSDYFSIFKDFRRFVDHFLLQDLTTNDYKGIKFLMPFDSFSTPSVPRDLIAYRAYKKATIEFINARNSRIASLGVHA